MILPINSISDYPELDLCVSGVMLSALVQNLIHRTICFHVQKGDRTREEKGLFCILEPAHTLAEHLNLAAPTLRAMLLAIMRSCQTRSSKKSKMLWS